MGLLFSFLTNMGLFVTIIMLVIVPKWLCSNTGGITEVVLYVNSSEFCMGYFYACMKFRTTRRQLDEGATIRCNYSWRRSGRNIFGIGAGFCKERPENPDYRKRPGY
jgi:hypothetical protein